MPSTRDNDDDDPYSYTSNKERPRWPKGTSRLTIDVDNMSVGSSPRKKMISQEINTPATDHAVTGSFRNFEPSSTSASGAKTTGTWRLTKKRLGKMKRSLKDKSKKLHEVDGDEQCAFTAPPHLSYSNKHSNERGNDNYDRIRDNYDEKRSNHEHCDGNDDDDDCNTTDSGYNYNLLIQPSETDLSSITDTLYSPSSRTSRVRTILGMLDEKIEESKRRTETSMELTELDRKFLTDDIASIKQRIKNTNFTTTPPRRNYVDDDHSNDGFGERVRKYVDDYSHDGFGEKVRPVRMRQSPASSVNLRFNDSPYYDSTSTGTNLTEAAARGVANAAQSRASVGDVPKTSGQAHMQSPGATRSTTNSTSSKSKCNSYNNCSWKSPTPKHSNASHEGHIKTMENNTKLSPTELFADCIPKSVLADPSSDSWAMAAVCAASSVLESGGSRKSAQAAMMAIFKATSEASSNNRNSHNGLKSDGGGCGIDGIAAAAEASSAVLATGSHQAAAAAAAIAVLRASERLSTGIEQGEGVKMGVSQTKGGGMVDLGAVKVRPDGGSCYSPITWNSIDSESIALLRALDERKAINTADVENRDPNGRSTEEVIHYDPYEPIVDNTVTSISADSRRDPPPNGQINNNNSMPLVSDRQITNNNSMPLVLDPAKHVSYIARARLADDDETTKATTTLIDTSESGSTACGFCKCGTTKSTKSPRTSAQQQQVGAVTVGSDSSGFFSAIVSKLNILNNCS